MVKHLRALYNYNNHYSHSHLISADDLVQVLIDSMESKCLMKF